MNIFNVKKSIFQSLKEYVEENNSYNALVLTRATNNQFPLVVFEENRNELEIRTTNYKTITRILNYNVNIYAKDINEISGNDICEVLAQLVIEVMQGYYNCNGGIVALIPRYDNNVTSYQMNLRFTTRYIPSQNKIF